MRCQVILDHEFDSTPRVFEGWWYRRHFIRSFGTTMVTSTFRISSRTTTRWLSTGTGSTTTGTPTTPHFVSQLSSISPPIIYLEEFCFGDRLPFQPPNILPISLTFSESWIYLLLSKDFVSQRIIRKIFKVSVLRMANLTYGNFSSRDKKLAMVIASIISTRIVSTRFPREYLCSLGKIL